MKFSPATGGRTAAASLVASLLFALVLSGCGEEADPLDTARARHEAGDLEGSLEILGRLVEERPDDPEVLYLYGSSLALSGQVSQSRFALEAAMESPEWLVPAGRQLALSALRMGDHSGAVDAADRILKTDPDNYQALLIRAEARAYLGKDVELALEDVERAAALEPDSAETLKPQVLALIELDRIEEAEAVLEDLGARILENDPGPALGGWHCAIQATFITESGEVERAGKLWTDCLERYPSHPTVVSNAVSYYDEQGDIEKTIEILRKAIEEVPEGYTLKTSLAQRLRQVGRAAEAEEVLLEAAQTEVTEIAVLASLELAEHYQFYGQYKKGAAAADRAVEIAEKGGFEHPHLPFEHAEALLLAGEYRRALAVTEKMELRVHQELIRARVAQDTGDFDAALVHYSEATKLWPDNAAARYMAAVAAEGAKNFDRAIEEYRNAIRTNPGEADARLRLARLHLGEGRPADGLAVLRTRPEQFPLDAVGDRLSLRLWAQTGQKRAVEAELNRLVQMGTPLLHYAYISIAEGIAASGGPEAAMERLANAEAIDLSEPRNAPALDALVGYAADAGQLDFAEKIVRKALEAHPEAAAFHAVQGRLLAAMNVSSAEVKAAYDRALEIDPKLDLALIGQARLLRASEPSRGAKMLQQVAARNPEDLALRREAAAALASAGHPEEAMAVLEALLREHPESGAAALELAELRRKRGDEAAELVPLGAQAVRFGGELPALEFLRGLYEEVGEEDKARELGLRIERVRARADSSEASATKKPVPPG